MRKMVKNVGKLLIVSAMMVAFVGCGPEADKTNTTKSTTATKTTEATTEKETEKKEETTTAAETTEATEAPATEGAEEGAEVKPDEGGRVMIAYTKDGSEVNLTESEDDVWVTDNGDSYYLGDDGVLRSRGLDDLFVTNPAE